MMVILLLYKVVYMECPICFNETLSENLITTNCNHIYCYDCFNKWLIKDKTTCPICRINIDFFEYNNKNYKLHIIEKKIINNVVSNQQINNNRYNISKSKYFFFLSSCVSSFFLLSFNLYLILNDCQY